METIALLLSSELSHCVDEMSLSIIEAASKRADEDHDDGDFTNAATFAITDINHALLVIASSYYKHPSIFLYIV